MIAQRRKFIMKKEQLDMHRMKNDLMDTSISNFSQASGHVAHNVEKKPRNFSSINDNGDAMNQENMRLAQIESI